MILATCDLSAVLQQLPHQSSSAYQREFIQPFHRQLLFASLKDQNRQNGMHITMAPIGVQRSYPVR